MKNQKLTILLGVLLTAVVAVALVFKGDVLPAKDSSSAPQTSTESSVTETEMETETEKLSTEESLKAAWEANNDVVGWLIVDGCEIDNRVFQSWDNETYLRLDEDGKSDVWGCYFLDYINIIDEGKLIDKVSIIYGHSLNDVVESEKFSKLKRYKDASFAAQHPEITFQLMDGTTQWQIFSACDIPVTIDYIDPNPDDAKYDATLKHMLDNSYVDFGVEVTNQDQILVLSTCTSNENVRFVVAAKLVK